MVNFFLHIHPLWYKTAPISLGKCPIAAYVRTIEKCQRMRKTNGQQSLVDPLLNLHFDLFCSHFIIVCHTHSGPNQFRISLYVIRKGGAGVELVYVFICGYLWIKLGVAI